MSEHTLCNRCTLNDIRRRHPQSNITLKAEDGWIICYVDGKRMAGFLRLTDECAC